MAQDGELIQQFCLMSPRTTETHTKLLQSPFALRFHEWVIVALPAAVGEPFDDAQVNSIIDMAEDFSLVISMKRDSIDVDSEFMSLLNLKFVLFKMYNPIPPPFFCSEAEAVRHMLTCEERAVRCPNCAEVMKRGEVDEHNRTQHHIEKQAKEYVNVLALIATDDNKLLHQVAQANFGHYRVRLTHFGQDIPDNQDPIDAIDATTFMTKNGFSPKILVSNIEGARSKSAELSCILGEENIDILLATETHLNPQVNSCEILPQDFLVYRKDRPSHKGGVLIAVKNNLVSIPRPGLDSDCEIVWCEVLLDKETNLLCSYYRQQSLGMISLDALDNFLSKVTKLAGNRHVILTGDFNLPSIDWATSSVPLVQKMQTSAGVYLILLMISILSNGSMSLQDTAPLLLTLWICGDLEPRAQYEQNLPLF
ncbi:predicted protein [Nematostella vectensis]|uniref:Endonuclease/exonuclease/phosphatase domain-containing protein n=1 Tax=Nematostella vectensis TaxID=45351 RepID=A7RS49_NEMVE|nr:predicted protein [Nematostella vectensis]|eukprot:XP_001637807.1 predicted protein [Nematostella vectensis]